MGEYAPTNADQSLYGTAQNGWYVNSVGIASGVLTTLDWDWTGADRVASTNVEYQPA